jgi:hypothetical protein
MRFWGGLWFIHLDCLCVLLFRGAGGGEVSGGGTLYMKWGADNYYCHKRGLWGERIF